MNKRTIVIIISILVILFIGLSIFTILNKKQEPSTKGSSSFPSLDIVAGEVSEQDTNDIKSSLSNISGKEIASKDIAIRKNSYKKSYATDHRGYTISFLADIEKVKSSYDVSIQYIFNSSMGVVTYCSDSQMQDYTCIDNNRIVESE